ncbi:M48 family metalloprotease [Mucilaginibacter sp. 21P]|uniref:M56 family metallopeptidase n=1 Tax=Mucilaginibacter sp. 21P TaxID=2778902 RepID=UPI001C560992|nr:M56 family metallopeptidase [Mucilaginibacter sp. 21P]QXV65531.1 M48 family metalloprotease [Mucilaginibacter sp. 21P]
MQNILYNISQVLGISIVHSLWQGLLVYFLLKLTLTVFNTKLNPAEKYLVSVAALFAISIWFAVTLINEVQAYNWLNKPTTLANMPLLKELPKSFRNVNEDTLRYYYNIQDYMPYITAVYVVGLLLNIVKVVFSHRRIKAIKRSMSLGVQLQSQISKFAAKFEITKKVKVGFSALVDVPCVAGYLKPVIMLPVTLSTYLEADEIEAILLHELAHIKRNDYLVNLLQQVITTLLFFNPCVLLINKIIGEERENACDDMVVNATATPVIYAKALFKLEQSRQNQLQLALAVTGKKYHLLNRIERIMKTKKQIPSIRPTLVAMLILTLSICSFALLKPEIAQGKMSVKAIMPAIKSIITADTVPTKVGAATKPAKAGRADKSAKAKAPGTLKYRNDTYIDGVRYNGFKDAELDRLSKEVEKHGNAIGKFYENADFKSTTAEMEKMGKEMSAYYESDAIKQATKAQELAAADYEKSWAVKGKDMEKLGKQMGEMGDKMGKYYNSKEFKELNARIAKKYNIDPEASHNFSDREDPNYRKYQQELDQNIPADVKGLSKQMKDLGTQMRDISGNPDLIRQQNALRDAGENMRKAFASKDMKAVQAKMQRLSEQMRAYQTNPQMREEQQALQAASKKMRDYMATPAFKKKLAEYRAAHPDYGWTDRDLKEEVKEAPESKEQPEAQ